MALFSSPHLLLRTSVIKKTKNISHRGYRNNKNQKNNLTQSPQRTQRKDKNNFISNKQKTHIIPATLTAGKQPPTPKGYGEPRRTPRLNDPAEFNGASREKYRQDPQD